jgi:hypothetical protein
MPMISRHSIFEDSIPRRLVVDRRKQAKTPSSHGLRIVAAHLTPAVAKFAVTPAGLRERDLYREWFRDAGMMAPR